MLAYVSLQESSAVQNQPDELAVCMQAVRIIRVIKQTEHSEISKPHEVRE